ncbi:DUF7716 domain-containing protein [Serratia ficaria]|uniref:DUF7716 domain-containing protein n=1 Tax=Serratia ficaria TaxID=61651 RepID=UPI00217B6C96|nr:hypothetical protein [Serratia ficaria]CAI1736045.1 Uncharacterised protein [Serratia ficaria]
MKTINGFKGLLSIYKNLPKFGGFFVDEDFVNRAEHIESARYYLSETPDEDDDMEDEYKTWLEYPTFRAIIENKIDHNPAVGEKELLQAVVYYLENDDFQD